MLRKCVDKRVNHVQYVLLHLIERIVILNRRTGVSQRLHNASPEDQNVEKIAEIAVLLDAGRRKLRNGLEKLRKLLELDDLVELDVQLEFGEDLADE